jgi:hypothetical protein
MTKIDARLLSFVPDRKSSSFSDDLCCGEMRLPELLTWGQRTDAHNTYILITRNPLM